MVGRDVGRADRGVKPGPARRDLGNCRRGGPASHLSGLARMGRRVELAVDTARRDPLPRPTTLWTGGPGGRAVLALRTADHPLPSRFDLSVYRVPTGQPVSALSVTKLYPLARKPSMICGSAAASRVVLSSGLEPTCISTIAPGLAAARTRSATFCTVMPPDVPFHPSESTVQRTGT